MISDILLADEDWQYLENLVQCQLLVSFQLTGEITTAIFCVTQVGSAEGCGFIDISSSVVIDAKIIIGSSQYF